MKAGDKVIYCGKPALVSNVQKNGIRISYEGCGLRQGETVVRRVPASAMTSRYPPRPPNQRATPSKEINQ